MSVQKVKFNQICKNVSNRINDPKQANTDFYVGLEHLDSEEPKILRHGSPNDVDATKLKFKSGHILFGKRRWYQRKLAVADREGICSAHMLVLEPIEGLIVKDFLSILMQSEDFFEKALRVSAGSLSPTIKWKDIAKEEFLIPSIPDQESLLTLIYKIDNVISNTQNLIEKTKIYSMSKRELILTKGIGHNKFKKIKWFYEKELEIPEKWNIDLFENLYTLVKGKLPKISFDEKKDDRLPYLTSDNLNGGLKKYVQKSDGVLVNKSDIFMIGDGEGSGRVYSSKEGILASTFMLFRKKQSKIDNKFLFYYLQYNYPLFRYTRQGTGIPHVDNGILKNLPIPILPKNEEQKIIAILSNLDEQIFKQKSHLDILKIMRKSILNSNMIGRN